MVYRDDARPKHECIAHSKIQAASWGHGFPRGLWVWRCIMCGAEAPWWKWALVPLFPILKDLPTGPGPHHVIDPRLSDEELRRYGFSEETIQNRVREIEPPFLRKLIALTDRR